MGILKKDQRHLLEPCIRRVLMSVLYQPDTFVFSIPFKGINSWLCVDPEHDPVNPIHLRVGHYTKMWGSHDEIENYRPYITQVMVGKVPYNTSEVLNICRAIVDQLSIKDVRKVTRLAKMPHEVILSSKYIRIYKYVVGVVMRKHIKLGVGIWGEPSIETVSIRSVNNIKGYKNYQRTYIKTDYDKEPEKNNEDTASI